MTKHTQERRNVINNILTKHLLQLLNSPESQAQCFQEIDNLKLINFSLQLNTNGWLELYSADLNQSVSVDFNSNDIQNKINPQQAKPAILKAIEGRSNHSLKVLDGTAGLGSDSFVIASRKHTVTSTERSGIIYLLLLDGLRRANLHETIGKYANNITPLYSTTENFLSQTKETFDVIYLDPMFPERKKSAKVKKGMQILQLLLGHANCNESKLFEMAFSRSKKLVIKRAINNPYFAERKPTNSLKGKTNRFDIYV